MNGKDAKKAFRAAEKDRKVKEIEKFKEMVKATLEKLESKKREKRKLDKAIQILKKDIDDLKAGRLDKIAERQDKDEEAEDISVFKVIKETEIIREVPYPVPMPEYPIKPWYEPYRITWCDNISAVRNAGSILDGATVSYVNSNANNTSDIVLCSSDTKYNTTGSYKLDDGSVKNI